MSLSHLVHCRWSFREGLDLGGPRFGSARVEEELRAVQEENEPRAKGQGREGPWGGKSLGVDQRGGQRAPMSKEEDRLGTWGGTRT